MKEVATAGGGDEDLFKDREVGNGDLVGVLWRTPWDETMNFYSQFIAQENYR